MYDKLFLSSRKLSSVISLPIPRHNELSFIFYFTNFHAVNHNQNFEQVFFVLRYLIIKLISLFHNKEVFLSAYLNSLQT